MGSSFLQAGDVAGTDVSGMSMDDIDLSRIGTGRETAEEKKMEEIGSKVNLDDLEKRVKAMNAEAVKALQESEENMHGPATSLLETGEADKEADKQVKAGDADARAKTWLNDMASIGAAKTVSSEKSSSKMDAQMKSWVAEFDRIKDEGLKNLDALRPRPKISFDELEKKIHALEVLTGVDTKKAQQSLLETDAPKPSFASVSAKISALEEKLAGADKKTSDAKAAPSSLIQLAEQFDPRSSLV